MDILGSSTDFALVLVVTAIILLLLEGKGNRKKRCAACHGLGRLYETNESHSLPARCQACQGTGKRK